MRLIDRYICREVFSHALLGLAVFTFVFFVPQLVRLMELVVRHAGGLGTVAALFVCTLPGVLTFTLPMAVLVGVLIGLGRMSADGEVIALQSLGLGRQRLLAPIVALAMITGMLTLLMTFWLGPAAVRTFRGLEDELRASQASFQVQPRVFDERFPRMVLYVQDVEAGGTRWRGLFLAESGAESGSRLTLAEEAIVIADREQGKLQFHLRNGSTHEYNAEQPDRYSVTTFAESDLPVPVAGVRQARERQLSMPERGPGDLLAVSGERRSEALIEFHRRLAFPAACLVFALLGVPMGARPRRGGRAAGFVVTLLLICGYYVLFTAGVGLARQGALPPALGVWAANIVVAAVALSLMRRIEQIRGESRIDILFDWARRWWRRRRRAAPAATEAAHHLGLDERLPQLLPGGRVTGGLPSLVDLYILRHFFYYFVGMLLGFVVLLEVFTFFELLDDIGRHNVP
ncbi:MAG TPA: LPS export ABC transporter permease LptF, partial [Candidatus Acidoferrales bacterium]